MPKPSNQNDDDDDIEDKNSSSTSSTNQEEEDDFLFCDALPHSTNVELNLVDCMTGFTTNYTGTTTISFHIEKSTTCLFFHMNNARVKIEKMQLHQGKHVLRPKCVYEMDSLLTSNTAAAAKKAPFSWQDEKTKTHVTLGPESKLLANLSVTDLKVVELPSPVSYCTIDLVMLFQSSLSEDGNGIYLCASRPVSTTAASNGMSLSLPSSFIATQFEVDHAHKSFPCIDFVFIRQIVKFILTVPVNAFCRSNGGGGSAEELSSNTSRNALFNPHPSQLAKGGATNSSNNMKKESLPASLRPIPFYIAGFIASSVPLVSAFETVTLPELRLVSSSSSVDDDTDEQQQEEEIEDYPDVPEETVEFCVVTTYDSPFMTEVALKSLIDATKELRQFFHCPIELPHLWILAAPKLVLGGMENDGFIFLKESLGVNNHSQPGQGRRSTEAATKELVRFIVHEVVHHWIGNRIGFSFAWKEGITLVLERYFGNVLLGLNPNQGSKGGSSTTESESAADTGKLVQVDSGKELSGTTYHKAESAMEAVVRKLGWKAFQNGVQKMIHGLAVGDYVDDKSISSFFKLKKKHKM